MCAIQGNVLRDLPDQGVAPWVSANDKPLVLSKPVSGNAAEQRLKTEVMQLPARDRRRLKEVPDVSGVGSTLSSRMETLSWIEEDECKFLTKCILYSGRSHRSHHPSSRQRNDGVPPSQANQVARHCPCQRWGPQQDK